MDQVHVVRHKVLVEGLSIRRVAREMQVSRNTIRRYVEGAPPGERAPAAPPPRPTFERARERLDALLTEAPRWTGGKQRLTAARLHQMLRAEGHAVGETFVKAHVREWKRQRREVFVPLVYGAGDLAQVDFFEVLVDLGDTRGKAWMFVLRLMHSKRDFAWLYPRQDQVCFLDGHVRAFEHFGCVPHRIAYDNLKPAVARLLAGSERELAPRFAALAAHYVFEPCFARPRTGHDKGGVEARGKGIRWQHLVPIPRGQDLSEVSAALLARLDAQARDTRDRDGISVMERFDGEHRHMLPLAAYRFEPAATRFASITRRSLAKVDGSYYSAPCRWAGREVTAYVGVDEVTLVLPDGERVRHPRARFGGRSVTYRHYLPELARKPQAVRQVAAELVIELGAPFAAAWRLLVDAHGPRQAARQFASVLAAIVDDGEEAVARRLERALRDDLPIPLALAPAAPCEPLLADAALPAALTQFTVEAGNAADYDALVTEEEDV